MKVLYDYQAFSLQRFGGISNYFVQIIKNLPSDVRYEIAIKESNNLHLQDCKLLNIKKKKKEKEFSFFNSNFIGKSWLYNKISEWSPFTTSLGRNRAYSIEMIKSGDFDVFHPTFYSDYFLPYLNNKPYVLTVHDMIPELFNKQFNRRNIQLENKKKLAEMLHIL